MKKIYYLFIVFLTLSSCSNSPTDFEPVEPQTQQDIINYLNENNLTATRTNSGLFYIIEEEGTGINPTETFNVTITYKGYLLDGTVFNESSKEGISFDLNTVIPGWTEGIQFFKKGGKGKLFIISDLYGNQAFDGVPEGSVLVFDINLLAIENKQDIDIYLEQNNINATKTAEGLYYIIEEEGSGVNPNSNSNVTVAYSGRLLNGTTFDESTSGISFNLNRVIPGWTLGIPLFKEGGKGKLFIPPSLAYGNSRIGEIPPNSALVFDINLISVNN